MRFRRPLLTGFNAVLGAATVLVLGAWPLAAQTPPSPTQVAAYDGLHRAAYRGDLGALRRLVASGADLEARDDNRRTPIIVAAFASHEAVVAELAGAGADVNALDADRYDMVTIAAVADDIDMLTAALAAGNRPDLVTSRYDGTALIAAAHLGHADVVGILIAAGAPLDHVNNLGWTALIEAVVLGDGGPAHVATVRLLVEAGADRKIADGSGRTALDHARALGFAEIAALMEE